MSKPTNADGEPVAIGSRLEPLVDDYLFAHLEGRIELRLHPPVKRRVVMQTDAPGKATPVSTARSCRTIRASCACTTAHGNTRRAEAR
jgi:hypothetical protein